MKIEFDVPMETPLALADAIIEREIKRAVNEKIYNENTMAVARENIRQIGQALINYVWSQDRLNREFEKR